MPETVYALPCERSKKLEGKNNEREYHIRREFLGVVARIICPNTDYKSLFRKSCKRACLNNSARARTESGFPWQPGGVRCWHLLGARTALRLGPTFVAYHRFRGDGISKLCRLLPPLSLLLVSLCNRPCALCSLRGLAMGFSLALHSFLTTTLVRDLV